MSDDDESQEKYENHFRKFNELFQNNDLHMYTFKRKDSYVWLHAQLEYGKILYLLKFV